MGVSLMGSTINSITSEDYINNLFFWIMLYENFLCMCAHLCVSAWQLDWWVWVWTCDSRMFWWLGPRGGFTAFIRCLLRCFFFWVWKNERSCALDSFVNGQSLEAVVRKSPLCAGFSHIPQGSLFSLGFVYIFLIIYWFMYGSWKWVAKAWKCDILCTWSHIWDFFGCCRGECWSFLLFYLIEAPTLVLAISNCILIYFFVA